MRILIKNGHIVDPANKIDEVLDILVEAGKISKVAKNIKAGADEIIEAVGKIVMPGLIDMHVHLREPGREDKENIFSGTKAALKGGVTSVLAMPNTIPAIDSVENVELLQSIIKKSAQSNVFIAAAITKERAGKEIVPIKQMKERGVLAITDDGSSVDDEVILFEAFKKAKALDIPVICHSEDKKLSNGGVINLGFISTKLGLRGISKESEFRRIERDIELADKAAAQVHIAHVSCKESVEIIRKAKKKGIRVTAETAPHYFSLTDEAVIGYDTNMKMNPPLRSVEDKEAIKAGLKDGTIDVIASDHAPHTENEKDIEFERAEFGVVGLETELAVAITELIENKILDWTGLVEKFSLNPAKVLNLDRGCLSVGQSADIVIVLPNEEWVVCKADLISKSKNSSFLGRKLKGQVDVTILGGKIVYQRMAV